MNWINFLGVFGFVLNVVGIVIAGLAIYDETISKDLQPTWRRALKSTEVWIKRKVLRRPPTSVQSRGSADGMTIRDGVAIVAHGHVGTGDPVEDRLREIEAKHEQLEVMVKARMERLQADQQAHRETFDAWRNEHGQAHRDVEARERSSESRTKNLEMVGLLAVAVGAACQGLAALLS